MVILVFVAVGIVTKNVILPFLPSERHTMSVDSDEETIENDEDTFEEFGFMGNGSGSVADFNKIDWALDYLRDPFMNDPGTSSDEKLDAWAASGENELTLQDVLVAVVHESGTAFAVINDVIVGEGDYYYDYRVLQIGLDSVKLEGPGGYKILEF